MFETIKKLFLSNIVLRGERLFQNCTFIKGVEKLQSECKEVNDSKTPITRSENTLNFYKTT